MTFGETGAVPEDHESADKVMHGSLEVTELIRLYVSDVTEGMSPDGFVQGTNVTRTGSGSCGRCNISSARPRERHEYPASGPTARRPRRLLEEESPP